MYSLHERIDNGDWMEVCKSSMQGCKNKAAKMNQSEGNLGKEFLIRHCFKDLLRSVNNGSGRMEWNWAGKQDLTCCFKKARQQIKGEVGSDLE